MRRVLAEDYQITQVWTRNPSTQEVADENKRRAMELLGLENSLPIPIHAIVTPDDELLSTYTYSSTGTAEEYVTWLVETRRAWRAE